MFCVYILKSLKDGNFYIGKTNDLQRRLREHNGGFVSSTEARRPFVVLGSFDCLTEKDALRLEKEYKKGYKREELKKKYNLT